MIAVSEPPDMGDGPVVTTPPGPPEETTGTHHSTDPRIARCPVRGCCWRGRCPLHDVTEALMTHLAALVAERPFGRRWAA